LHLSRFQTSPSGEIVSGGILFSFEALLALNGFLGSISTTLKETRVLVELRLRFYLVKRDHQQDFPEREAVGRVLCNLEHLLAPS
jgi:hypothetical protein